MDINYRKSGYIHSLSNLNVKQNNNKILSNHPSLSNKNFSTIESCSRSIFPQSKSVSKLNYNHNTFSEMNDMIEQCRINKKLGTNYYYEPDKGYTSTRGNYCNKSNPFEVFKIKKEYLLTDTPLSSGRGERRVKMSYRNNSRLKDKMNELIELTKVKKEKISENDKKKEVKNTTSETTNNNTINGNDNEIQINKKTLSEQRKDIYDLLSEKSYFLSSFSPVKSKFRYKALEIEASPYIIRNHSKVNSFFNNNSSSRTTTIGTNESNVLNTSSSCSKINLINKMIDMKLSNNHLYKKNSSNSNNMFLLSYSNRNKNVINKKTENEYRIKNKIKDLTNFKFSHNYNARHNYRENEIKENNLQIISMIKSNIKDNINKSMPNKIGNHHKRSSTYEDIDIDIDKQVENNINKTDNVKKECK